MEKCGFLASFKKGTIIRRALNDGTPVGDYMCIDKVIRRTHVMARRITNTSGRAKLFSILFKSHVYVVRTSKLVISDDIWERINTNRQHSIIHDATVAWNKLQDNEAEVVQLRSIKYSQKVMLFTVDQIADVWYNRQRQIRLDLGYRIL